MVLARRKFLRSSLLFGASAVLFCANSPSGFAHTFLEDGAIPTEVLSDPLYRFTKETFEPYVGGYFEAPGVRGAMVPLKLIKVESYVPQSDTRLSTREPLASDSFLLLFKADAALPHFSSIHQIKHGALGDFRLFLTRRDGSNGEIFYEAVFNRLR